MDISITSTGMIASMIPGINATATYREVAWSMVQGIFSSFLWFLPLMLVVFSVFFLIWFIPGWLKLRSSRKSR